MKLMNIPYNNYKTQKCKYFDDTGNCKFGKNCSYAHGEQELRNPYDQLPINALYPPNMDTSQPPLPFDMFAAMPGGAPNPMAYTEHL
jgi:hypothetical protein